eukprot:1256843-Amphidinium_carterae.1
MLYNDWFKRTQHLSMISADVLATFGRIFLGRRLVLKAGTGAGAKLTQGRVAWPSISDFAARHYRLVGRQSLGT